MNAQEINSKKEIGDFKTAAKMIGVTTEAARMLFSRPEAAQHVELCNAMTLIIEKREGLINEAQANNITA